MDNNKKVQLDRIEYESMHKIQEVSKVNNIKNKINTDFKSPFSEVMKKAKKKYRNPYSNMNDDIVVESSLKELIDEDNEIKKVVEEKISSSPNIKKLVFKEDEASIKESIKK